MQIIIALPIESQGIFEANKAPVHFCGIGKINAAAKATEVILLQKPQVIINLGTAGSHKFPTHSMIECSGYVQRDMDLTPLGMPLGETPLDTIKGHIAASKIFTELPKGICGTGDAFEIGPPKLDCDLVDMEAYALAKVCLMHKIPFVSIKYITDGSDHNAHNDWRENLKPASKSLFEIYQKIKNLI